MKELIPTLNWDLGKKPRKWKTLDSEYIIEKKKKNVILSFKSGGLMQDVFFFQ